MYDRVIKYARNYDLVVNYKSSSFITTRIKDFYLETIINDTNYKKITTIDTVIGQYFKNEEFKQFLKLHINDYNDPKIGIDYFYDMEYILLESYKKYKKKEKVITYWL
ncbi:MAG: hypothetical protein RSE21_04490 [Bacilli bacterium]